MYQTPGSGELARKYCRHRINLSRDSTAIASTSRQSQLDLLSERKCTYSPVTHDLVDR